MAKINVLNSVDIDNLLSVPQTYYFFVNKNKQRLRNEKFEAIGIANRDNAVEALTAYFRGDKNKTQEYVLAPITFNTASHLQAFFSKGQIQRFCIVDIGIFTQQAVVESVQLAKIQELMTHKLDNEHFYWIGFSDGRSYLKDEALCLYLNQHEAQHEAEKVGGYLGSFTIVEPVFTNCIKTDSQYRLGDMSISGYVLKNACQQHFNKTMLPFSTIKTYIDKGLSVFAGQNDWDEFELFTHQGMSTLFSPQADRSLIHPLMQQSLPDDSQFFLIEKRESLYEFVSTKYVAIDCMYHCERAVFEDAIMGRNDYRQWTHEELIAKAQELFNKNYLYIILSRDDYKDKTHSSYPSIINAEQKKVWIFEDYGKALNFCQQKDRFIDNNVPAIGLLTSYREGWDLHNILSLLTTIDVQNVELNPLEEDRMLLPIRFLLKANNLPTLEKKDIHKICLDESEQMPNTPWIFNDIVLA